MDLEYALFFGGLGLWLLCSSLSKPKVPRYAIRITVSDDSADKVPGGSSNLPKPHVVNLAPGEQCQLKIDLDSGKIRVTEGSRAVQHH